jgi:hypothetical protein
VQKGKEPVVQNLPSVLRVLLLTLVMLPITPLIAITTTKNETLMDYYNKTLGVVAQYCDKTKYFNPNLITVNFDNLSEDILGECRLQLNGYTLMFDKKKWTNLSESDKNQLMIHEVTHCIFGMGHVNDPTHYMNPFMMYLDSSVVDAQFRALLIERCGK